MHAHRSPLSLPGFRNLAEQFQRAGKLPTTRYIFPTAPFNHEASERAWYPPVSPHFEDTSGNADDINDYLPAIATAEALIQEEVKSGIPRSRIVLGGFSQGSAVTALWALLNQRNKEEKLAGWVSFAGYVPLRGSLDRLIKSDRELIKDQPVCVIHGDGDSLIPVWVAQKGIAKLEELGFEVNWAILPGMQHNITGQSLGMLCQFLESLLHE